MSVSEISNLSLVCLVSSAFCIVLGGCQHCSKQGIGQHRKVSVEKKVDNRSMPYELERMDVRGHDQTFKACLRPHSKVLRLMFEGKQSYQRRHPLQRTDANKFLGNACGRRTWTF